VQQQGTEARAKGRSVLFGKRYLAWGAKKGEEDLALKGEGRKEKIANRLKEGE